MKTKAGADQPTKTIYVTKYALTRGVLKVEARTTSIGGLMAYRSADGMLTTYVHPKDYEVLETAAMIKGRRMIESKIRSLKRQIEKLDTMAVRITEL